MNRDLRKIRSIADYQFGQGCGAALFPEEPSIDYSKNTGRIRLIKHDKVLLASLNPTDGMFTLTIEGAKRLVYAVKGLGCTVTVQDDVADYISERRNVFAKHVVDAGEGIRPGDETIVLDSKKRVLAVGRALLNRREMLAFNVGVAVKTRRGRNRNS